MKRLLTALLALGCAANSTTIEPETFDDPDASGGSGGASGSTGGHGAGGSVDAGPDATEDAAGGSAGGSAGGTAGSGTGGEGATGPDVFETTCDQVSGEYRYARALYPGVPAVDLWDVVAMAYAVDPLVNSLPEFPWVFVGVGVRDGEVAAFCGPANSEPRFERVRFTRP